MFSVNCNKNTLLSNLCFSKWSIQQITVLLRKGFFYKEEEEAKVEQILSCNFFLQFYYFPITMAEAIFLEMDPGQSKALILPTGWQFSEVSGIVCAGTHRKKIGPRGLKKIPSPNPSLYFVFATTTRIHQSQDFLFYQNVSSIYSDHLFLNPHFDMLNFLYN